MGHYRDAMQPPSRVAILNAGGWGTALAALLARGGRPVTLWARRAELVEQLRRERQNRDYLPGVELPETVEFTASLEQAVADCAVVVLVPVPRRPPHLA